MIERFHVKGVSGPAAGRVNKNTALLITALHDLLVSKKHLTKLGATTFELLGDSTNSMVHPVRYPEQVPWREPGTNKARLNIQSLSSSQRAIWYLIYLSINHYYAALKHKQIQG